MAVPSYSAHPSYAPYVPTSFFVQIFSVLRAALYALLMHDNPLTWWWMQGKRNNRADMEGPLYMPGAPSRMIAPGKAVLASVDELKQFSPFLLQLTIRSPKGDPLPNAQVDFRQADSNGEYAYRSYALRGKFTTDANGNVDILTVVPGDYGAKSAVRAGHFHIMMWDGEKKYDFLTTQLYVCKGNSVAGMQNDFLNRVRKPRTQNMLRAWSIPANSNGVAHHNMPELPADDLDTLKRVEWWNSKLREDIPEANLKIVGGGQTEFTLNEKGFLGF